MSEREDALQAEMILGDDATRFMESDLGRTVLGMADQEKQEALVALSEVDPEDSKAIRDLQNQVWRANSLAAWLLELISKGKNAENILIHEAENE